jgi:hypothetical protein
VALLGLQAQRRGRAGFQPAQADRLTGHFAEAVRPVLDPAQSRIDLGDQLALAVAGAQFKRLVAFRRRPVDNIGQRTGLVLQICDGLLGAVQNVGLPVLKQPAEVGQLPFRS